MYSLFNILHTHNQCYYFRLSARVFTVYCLISIELTTLFIARGWVLNPLRGEYWEILPLGTGFSDLQRGKPREPLVQFFFEHFR